MDNEKDKSGFSGLTDLASNMNTMAGLEEASPSSEPSKAIPNSTASGKIDNEVSVSPQSSKTAGSGKCVERAVWWKWVLSVIAIMLLIVPIIRLDFQNIVFAAVTVYVVILGVYNVRFQIYRDYTTLGLLLFSLTYRITLGLLMTDWAYLTDGITGLLVLAIPLFCLAYGYKLISKREGLGGGDLKLTAGIGLFLGAKLSLVFLVISIVTGFILVAVLSTILNAKSQVSRSVATGIIWAPAFIACYLIKLFLF